MNISNNYNRYGLFLNFFCICLTALLLVSGFNPKQVHAQESDGTLYLEQVGTTEGDFEMAIGTVASLDFMKVDMNNNSDYENAELEIFRPLHQNLVDAGNKGSWELLRVMNPVGSDTYVSHITVNMYEGWEQVFSGDTNPTTSSFAEDMMVQKGLETRDMKWSYLATLREMVR